jgi:hypothetical protein
LSPSYGKPLVNLLLSLSSNTKAKSVTGLSESSLYQYNYSSITDVIHNLCLNEADYEKVLGEVQELFLKYMPPSCEGEKSGLAYQVVQIDVCNAEKGFTPSFEGRTMLYKANNQVFGNKPVSPGYAVSYVNLCDSETGWSLPFSSDRVKVDESDSDCAHRQLLCLFGREKSVFKDVFSVAVLDRKYGNAAYLSNVYQYKNLINIVRHRSGSKVYAKMIENQAGGNGAPTQYGDCYYLISQDRVSKGKNLYGDYEKEQKSIFQVAADEVVIENTKTSKGKEIRVEIHRWNDLKIRTKDANIMKDKPLDLCCVKVFEIQSNKNLFKEELWFTINGQRKSEIPTKEAYLSYRKRYGIESFFRFNKQNLFFQDYQTPVTQHFDNWRIIAQIAVYMLFIAQKDMTNRPKKWQKYLKINKEIDQNAQHNLSMAQAYHSAEELFLTLDKKQFAPKTSNKPHGRREGEIQTKRTKFAILKKTKKKKIRGKKT